ncbi:hypothetical protein M5K25_019595 [Dendrobium thyrsiflorum]|uniref:Tyrosine decarboxylase n=1 Tax=Dendrobium thyrsiflorum TaxID=117978 RepID=A0ABD0UM82_DENTH
MEDFPHFCDQCKSIGILPSECRSLYPYVLMIVLDNHITSNENVNVVVEIVVVIGAVDNSIPTIFLVNPIEVVVNGEIGVDVAFVVDNNIGNTGVGGNVEGIVDPSSFDFLMAPSCGISEGVVEAFEPNPCLVNLVASPNISPDSNVDVCDDEVTVFDDSVPLDPGDREVFYHMGGLVPVESVHASQQRRQQKHKQGPFYFLQTQEAMGSLPTESFQPLDPDLFSKESKAVVDFIADYYRDIEHFPVRSQVKPGYLRNLIPDTPPLLPSPISTILHDIKTDIFPGLTHWQSPNFYAYYQANASTAGFAGEMLCSGLNVVGFSWVASPAATELETIVMDWMANMLKLPRTFLSGGRGGGVIHGSTCEAVVCTLAAARDNALSQSNGEGITKLTVYASDQTHFTFQKAAKLVGIPARNFRVISTSAETGYALTAENVRAAMDADVVAGMVPLYLCGTVGTTAVGAVDPLREIGEVAREFGVWFHVDAACAGSAAICPEFRRYFDGMETADSFSMNPHKWLLANMDCCCLWVKCKTKLVDSLSTKPEILRNAATEVGNVIDYKDWQIALSRRFRAMKLWVVIRRFGQANLMEHVRSDVDMAKHFEKLVAEDERFDLVVPRRFTLVCFKLRVDKNEGKKCREMNKKLLDSVNGSGKAFMTHAVVDGEFVLRFAVGGTLTEKHHVEATWRLVQEKASELLMTGWK